MAEPFPGTGVDDDENGYVDDIHGYNFVDNGPVTWNKSGDTGHGTFCAGTVAAVNNNGIGVCGVAKEVPAPIAFSDDPNLCPEYQE